jgi:hypothetical protein
MRQEECMVDLTLPIFSMDLIETMMPERVLKKLAETEVKVQDILARVHASGRVPQVLFEMHNEDRSYRVWIK